MTRYVAGRLAWLVVVLWVVSVVTFALGAAAPGDPVQTILDRTLNRPATAQDVHRTRERLRLDRPLAAQYLAWLNDAIHGDLGQSWVTGLSVSDSIRERFPRTLLLASTALVLSIALAVPFGVVSAYRRNTVLDHAGRIVALFAASIPGYFLAYVLIFVLAVRLKVVPVFGYGSASDLVLPALTLGLGLAAGLTRFTRAAVLEVLDESYMTTARAKGVDTPSLLFHHALRNAATPVVTVIGLSLAGLLGGAFIVEWVLAGRA